MITPDVFWQYCQWTGFATLACVGFTALAFIFKWGFRFRFVGISSIMGIVTFIFLVFSIIPYGRVSIVGAGRYSLVYDLSGPKAVITIPTPIHSEQLEATLLQAASDLFSPGRGGQGQGQLTIEARVITHPQPGVSKIIRIAEVKRSLTLRDDPNIEVNIDQNKVAPFIDDMSDPFLS
ncbi:MAG: DUF2518 family protein [Acaryochloridaceae cyanobacterium SU_2_1]|nr:DUF2518 family protein [Acaryochloridaceae cyanobacterium SU_2_1]